MENINNADDFIDYVEGRIYPYTLNEKGKATISGLYRSYDLPVLMESIDIGIKQYFKYDNDGTVTQEAVLTFIDKLGGIAYNKALPPIEQQIASIRTSGRSYFGYWDPFRATKYVRDYVDALKRLGWDEKRILDEFANEIRPLFRKCSCWSNWYETLESWTEQANQQVAKNAAEAKKRAEEKEKDNSRMESIQKLAEDHNTAVNQLKSIGKNVGDPMDDIVLILKKYDDELAILQQIETKLTSLGQTDDPEALKAGIVGVSDIITGLVACHRVMYRETGKEQEEGAENVG